MPGQTVTARTMARTGHGGGRAMRVCVRSRTSSPVGALRKFDCETNELRTLSLSIIVLRLAFSLKRTTVKLRAWSKEANEQAHCRNGSTDTGGLYH